MKNAVITKAYFERALLYFCGEGKPTGIRFVSREQNEPFLPLYIEESDGRFTVCFDLASGFGGHPLPSADWLLEFDGEVSIKFDDERDFSDNGGIYTVGMISDELGTTLHSEFSPTKDSIKLKLADLLFKSVFAVSNLFPKRGRNVLFTSQSRKELGGNEMCIYDEIQRRDELQSNFKIRFSFSDRGCLAFYIKTAWLLGKSDIIILDDYHPIVYRFKYKKSVKVVQLWHACGAFKTFGYSRLGKVGALRFDGQAHRCYTHAFVSGEGVRKYYAEAFGIPIDRVFATGVPRCDGLKKGDFCDGSFEKDGCLNAEWESDGHTKLKGQRSDRFTVIFAPTFRGNGKESAFYPFDKIDFNRLAEVCREQNMQIIFKMHPFVKEAIPIDGKHSDVLIDGSNVREINDLLPSADLVITDYSSVVYEASLLDIPMMFYVFDLDEYTEKRDFYQPFEAFAPGKAVNNFDDLITTLENRDFKKEKVAPFRDANFHDRNKNASKKIVDIIFGKE